eukprot:m.165299 g.165299  ORF g.165299 m.165299 type:complete len:143 (-) comp23991_c0_seq2:1476-1904(-)
MTHDSIAADGGEGGDRSLATSSSLRLSTTPLTDVALHDSSHMIPWSKLPTGAIEQHLSEVSIEEQSLYLSACGETATTDSSFFSLSESTLHVSTADSACFFTPNRDEDAEFHQLFETTSIVPLPPPSPSVERWGGAPGAFWL